MRLDIRRRSDEAFSLPFWGGSGVGPERPRIERLTGVKNGFILILWSLS